MPLDRFSYVQPMLHRVIAVALYAYALFAVVSISAMQTAYIFGLIAWIILLTLTWDTQSLRLPLLVPIGSFLLASVLATLTAVEPYRSLIELRNVLEILLFYLVINRVPTVQRATTLVHILIAVGTVIALYGLGQSFVAGTSLRIYGTMSHYMTFAGLLMLVALMALAQCVFRPPRHLFWPLLVWLCLIAALVMTHTRGAWVGFFAGCCVLLGLRKKLFVLSVPLMALGMFFLAPSPVQERAISLVDRRGITVQERFSMWKSGFQIFRDYPWTGIGMGAMSQMYARYREPDSLVVLGRQVGHLHNNVIQIAAERGLLGLACWVWIWCAYMRQAWHVYTHLEPAQREAKALVVGSLASVVAFHVEGLFEHTFGDSEVVTLVYFLMALPFVVQHACLATVDRRELSAEGHC